MKLSQRIEGVATSLTVGFTSLIEQFRGEGREIINFAVGEPEYATPEEIVAVTRAILVNSPNNPTGAVYPPLDLARIARLASDHDLWIIADEAYEFFVYDSLENQT
jgi:aspartate/methionine/tyrosine aminotransferase